MENLRWMHVLMYRRTSAFFFQGVPYQNNRQFVKHLVLAVMLELILVVSPQFLTSATKTKPCDEACDYCCGFVL